jgi:hypothetical protein
MVDKRTAYRTLVGKPEGKRPVEIPKHMWVSDIEMDHDGIVWIGLMWLRIMTYGGFL